MGNFKDNSFNYAVLCEHWKLGKISENEIENVLNCEEIQEIDDEDDKIEEALKILNNTNFNFKLTDITTLQHNLNFDLFIENIIDVETGGESNYMELSNIDGIQKLTNLKILNLRELNTCSGFKNLDLVAIKKHPTIEKIIFGNGNLKNINAITTIPNLKDITIYKTVKLDTKLSEELKSKHIKIILKDI